jgi:hypothetical protein
MIAVAVMTLRGVRELSPNSGRPAHSGRVDTYARCYDLNLWSLPKSSIETLETSEMLPIVYSQRVAEHSRA